MKSRTSGVFSAKHVTLTALAVAIVCISTAAISIPIPLGYMHLGNICILLCCFLFPCDTALIAAGLGSALADLLTGFPQWIVFTLIIKGTMGYVGARIAHGKSSYAQLRSIRTLISAVTAIAIMIIGYTVAGSILYGSIYTGILQIPGLATEGIIGIIGFYLIAGALEKCHIRRPNLFL